MTRVPPFGWPPSSTTRSDPRSPSTRSRVRAAVSRDLDADTLLAPMHHHIARASLVALLFASLGASGCQRRGEQRDPVGESAPTPPPPPPTQPPPTDPFQEIRDVRPPPAGMRCDDMNSQQCMLSTWCVLEAPPGGAGGPYVCRDSTGPCERGIAQAADDFRATCVERPGCAFREGSCMCFPQTRVPLRLRGPVPNCFCAGGPPRRCVASTDGG